MKLDVVIPAYNEERVIRETCKELKGILESIPSCDWSIVVSDNGSTDGTRKAVSDLGDRRIRVMQATKKGKGTALREAFLTSDADIVGFFDADLSVHPSILPGAMSMIAAREADVVIGSRFHGESLVDRGFFRSGTSKIFNILARLIIGLSFSDTQCGFKLMNHAGKSIVPTLQEETWFLDIEFLAHALKKGLSIREVPVRWTEFKYPDRRSKLKLFSDGVHAVGAMLRIRSRIRQTYG